jgi:hypothetical protein
LLVAHNPTCVRQAVCLLSGEGHEATGGNIELLRDIKLAFGDDEAIRSANLVAKLITKFADCHCRSLSPTMSQNRLRHSDFLCFS